jgi:hypothetical protein
METAGVKWTDVAQLGVSIVGFGFVWYQVRQLSKAVAGDAYASLYEQYVDMGKLFLERPHLRPFFYENLPVDDKVPGGQKTLAEVEILSELMTGLLEHAALQRNSMPKKIYKECWQEFTKDRFKSPALTAFWKKNKGWYASEFRHVVDGCLEGRQRMPDAAPEVLQAKR